MGNDYSENDVNAWDFMVDPQVEKCFSKLDYSLRNGVHIQRNENQMDIFLFLVKHKESLSKYYITLFGLYLNWSGEMGRTYFWLEFRESDRARVPEANRQFLNSEYIIVGILLYKAVYIDGNVGLESMQRIKQALVQGFPEYFQSLKRILLRKEGKQLSSEATPSEQIEMYPVIEDSLRAFAKLGWVTISGDFVEILPAFDKLILYYEEYINHPEKLGQTPSNL